jgi:Fe-S-cluster-containing dehydrogenase component
MCIGCGICASVCPFGAIHFSGGKAIKCDLCLDRLKEGRPPACVEMCPAMATQFGELEEVGKAKREYTADKIVEKTMEYVKLLAP